MTYITPSNFFRHEYRPLIMVSRDELPSPPCIYRSTDTVRTAGVDLKIARGVSSTLNRTADCVLPNALCHIPAPVAFHVPRSNRSAILLSAGNRNVDRDVLLFSATFSPQLPENCGCQTINYLIIRQ